MDVVGATEVLHLSRRALPQEDQLVHRPHGVEPRTAAPASRSRGSASRRAPPPRRLDVAVQDAVEVPHRGPVSDQRQHRSPSDATTTRERFALSRRPASCASSDRARARRASTRDAGRTD